MTVFGARAHRWRGLAGPVLAMIILGAASPSGAAPANGNDSGFRENQPSQSLVRHREAAAGLADQNGGKQDRELGTIGKHLLDETPKAPAGSTIPTGGGTTPRSP